MEFFFAIFESLTAPWPLSTFSMCGNRGLEWHENE